MVQNPYVKEYLCISLPLSLFFLCLTLTCVGKMAFDTVVEIASSAFFCFRWISSIYFGFGFRFRFGGLFWVCIFFALLLLLQLLSLMFLLTSRHHSFFVFSSSVSTGQNVIQLLKLQE